MANALANSQMRPGRFLRWHHARQRVAWIKAQLAAGRVVLMTTYTRQWRFRQGHEAMFRATKSGAYVQRGKAWDCIDGTDIRNDRGLRCP